VFLGVMLCGLVMVMLGMKMVPVRDVRVVRRLFVIAGFVMLRSFFVVRRRVTAMLGGVLMMFRRCMLGHGVPPIVCVWGGGNLWRRRRLPSSTLSAS
jgi:hypothetical protein